MPLCFVLTTTLVAGWRSIFDNFLPLTLDSETMIQGYVDTGLTMILMFAAIVIIIDSGRRWTHGKQRLSSR